MIKYAYNQLKTSLANKIEIEDRQYLYFGGTAYLGIPQNKEFLNYYLEGLSLFGINNGTSRGNNVQLGIYNEVEQYAANKYGSEEALISSSGYLAAQIVVKHFITQGELRYAPDSHPSLWINQKPTSNSTFKNWAINLVDEINTSDQKNWVIISNSMNNLYPEIYDFSFVKELNKEVTLIIDDSHGIGIINEGTSVLSSIPICENVEVLVVASMAKALGVDAGIIFGSAKNIQQLKQSNEFLGASPPTAAGLFAFMNAQKIYEAEYAKLNMHIALLSKALNDKKDWHFIPDFPVFFSKNADLSENLLEQNILVSSFPYPDKDGPMINRVVLSSWHTKADIEELIRAL